MATMRNYLRHVRTTPELPVNLPFSNFGVTIAVLDRDGNLTIKVDQPHDD